MASTGGTHRELKGAAALVVFLSLPAGGAGRRAGERAVDVATAGLSTEPPAGDAGPIRALPAWLATSRAESRENFPSGPLTIGRIHQSINQITSSLSAR